MAPHISIIIPVYNTSDYVGDCLRSILLQSFTDFEVLVIDDASSDNSLEIVKSFDDRRIRIFQLDKNQGQSVARNRGLDEARGKYISFVDSDDIIHSQMLEALNDGICQCDADFSFSSKEVKICNIKEAALENCLPCEVVCITEPLKQHLNNKHEVHMGIGAKLYKKELLEGMYFVAGIYYEDLLFSMQVLDRAKRTAYVNADLYFYIQRAGSTMQSQFSEHKAQSYLTVAREIYQHFSTDKLKLAAVQKRYINRMIKRCVKSIFNSADKENLLKTVAPEIQKMYQQKIINYKGLSIRNRWQLWQVLKFK